MATTEGMDNGVTDDVDRGAWRGVEEDGGEGFVNDGDAGTGVEEEGDGGACSGAISEAEERVSVGGADDVPVDEGVAVGGGTVGNDRGTIGAEDVGGRGEDEGEVVGAEAGFGEDVLARVWDYHGRGEESRRLWRRPG